MTAASPATDSFPQTAAAPERDPLADAIADLEAALRTLDALGLSVPALHVSMGLDLARELCRAENEPLASHVGS